MTPPLAPSGEILALWGGLLPRVPGDVTDHSPSPRQTL